MNHKNFIIANKKNTKPKFRKCKVCETRFEVNPFKPFIGWCSSDCGYKYQQRLAENKKKREEKEEREKTRIAKEKLLTHKDYLKLLQTVFNTYIRLRDKDLPCISCGTTAKIQYHAGHYFSSGGHPNLRFAETNVHKQCVQCNNYLHGNLINYRPALEQKIGSEEYEALCNNRDVPRKYSIPEIKELIIHYKQQIKKLK